LEGSKVLVGAFNPPGEPLGAGVALGEAGGDKTKGDAPRPPCGGE